MRDSLERVDRRVLGAVRFANRATGATVRNLEVRSTAGTWIPNASGLWVLHANADLAHHLDVFDEAPTDPAEASVTVSGVVSDPQRVYLSRAFSLAVPRVPPQLYQPEDVFLPPGPTAPIRRRWGTVAVLVQIPADAEHPEAVPVQGALVRVVDGTHLVSQTLTNDRGEAIVPIPGIPPYSTSGDDAVLRPEVERTVHVVVDVARTSRRTGAHDGAPNPDQLWSQHASAHHQHLQSDFDIQAGGTAARTFSIAHE